MTARCPATMCPLFAKDGSPWTGEKDAQCERGECGWWDGHCMGSDAAREQVAELTVGRRPLIVGKNYSDRRASRTTYDCARAPECQWQREAGENLCPPRAALALGLDPRACAW